jgi:hypothetical protein
VRQSVPEIGQVLHDSREASVDHTQTGKRSKDISVPGWLWLPQPTKQAVSEIETALDRELKPALHRGVHGAERRDGSGVGALVLLEVLQIEVQQPQELAFTFG